MPDRACRSLQGILLSQLQLHIEYLNRHQACCKSFRDGVERRVFFLKFFNLNNYLQWTELPKPCLLINITIADPHLSRGWPYPFIIAPYLISIVVLRTEILCLPITGLPPKACLLLAVATLASLGMVSCS
jgi:hypothetical protein